MIAIAGPGVTNPVTLADLLADGMQLEAHCFAPPMTADYRARLIAARIRTHQGRCSPPIRLTPPRQRHEGGGILLPADADAGGDVR